MLNIHIYCCSAGGDICATGEPGLQYAAHCQKFDSGKMRKRVANGKTLGVGTFMTEFGACANTEACVHEINSVTDAADDALVSWCYWAFKGFGDYTTTGGPTEGFYLPDGSLQTLKVGSLTRTYAQIVQGLPTFMRYDYNTTAFGFQYILDPAIQGSTVIYILDPAIQGSTVIYMNNDLHYTNGSKINIATQRANGENNGKTLPSSDLSHSLEGNYLTIIPQLGGEVVYSKTVVNVTITPKTQSANSGIKKILGEGFVFGWKIAASSDDGIITFKLASSSQFISLRIESQNGEELCTLSSSTKMTCDLPSYMLPGYSFVLIRDGHEIVENFTLGALSPATLLMEIVEGN